MKLLARQTSIFFPRKLAENYRNDDERILRTGTSEEIEELYVITEKNVLSSPSKLLCGTNRDAFRGFWGIFWDITERKRVEEELHLARFSPGKRFGCNVLD